jgi:Sucrose synthase
MLCVVLFTKYGPKFPCCIPYALPRLPALQAVLCVRPDQCLSIILRQAPDNEDLERFLSRLPFIFNIVIISVHGYIAQANTMGLPDTGGQVCPSVRPALSTWRQSVRLGPGHRRPGLSVR